MEWVLQATGFTTADYSLARFYTERSVLPRGTKEWMLADAKPVALNAPIKHSVKHGF